MSNVEKLDIKKVLIGLTLKRLLTKKQGKAGDIMENNI